MIKIINCPWCNGKYTHGDVMNNPIADATFWSHQFCSKDNKYNALILPGNGLDLLKIDPLPNTSQKRTWKSDYNFSFKEELLTVLLLILVIPIGTVIYIATIFWKLIDEIKYQFWNLTHKNRN